MDPSVSNPNASPRDAVHCWRIGNSDLCGEHRGGVFYACSLSEPRPRGDAPTETALRDLLAASPAGCACQACKNARAVLARPADAELVGALRKIAAIDHVGKDHSFNACSEIARRALAAHATETPREEGRA
jgi:hypothetical protein